MNEQLLKEATSRLRLHSIALESETLKTAKDFYPEFQHFAELAVQLKDEAIRCDTITSVCDSEEPDTLLFKHAFALRLLNESTTDDDGPPLVLLEIQATYRVSYNIKDEQPSNEATEEFARHNVPHHIWPFWREHVNATVVKTGFPSVIIPMRHL